MEEIPYNTGMPSARVTKHNWSASLVAAIEALLDASASYPQGSAEAEALIQEVSHLRWMQEMVRHRPPESRVPLTSPLLAFAARENLALSEALIEQVGASIDAGATS